MTISLPWLTDFFFIAIRLGMVLLFTPIQALRQLPLVVRLMFLFMLAMLMNHSLPSPKTGVDAEILVGSIMEFANGLILAASIAAAFTVFSIAGQLIDSIWGINPASIFNPAEHIQEPFMGHLLSMLAVMFFFSIDGHLWLFKGLYYSFVIIPPGSFSLFAGYTPVIKQFSFMFSLAFMIASPIVLALMIVDLSTNVMTRSMPQLNAYFLFTPVKIILGIITLMLMFDFINPISAKAFSYCFQTWKEVLV